MSDQDDLVRDEWRDLLRQARQMQTAYGVIQAIHGELSLEAITQGIATAKPAAVVKRAW